MKIASREDFERAIARVFAESFSTECGIVGIANHIWRVPLVDKLGATAGLSEAITQSIQQLRTEVLALIGSGQPLQDPAMFNQHDCESVARVLLSIANDTTAVSQLKLTRQDAGAVMLTAFGMIRSLT